ncbi:phospholipase A1-IIdelta [Euphorbia lathyris]|uniref:phospholipase A1-IIdelta n=1 Tax=Euphorbia lathyris TaxID=212925 RepID=UPI0033138662
MDESSSSSSSSSWSEIIGSNNWENILNPLDLNLRKLILRCGDLCQATYDSFNNDQNSKYCGSCRYAKHDLFQKVMFDESDQYQVHSFLYATAQVSLPEAFLLHSQSRESWDRESNWIGYIAVSTDERTKILGRREIYIALRGTTRNYEWINVFGAKLRSAKVLLKGSNISSSEINWNDSDSDSSSDGEGDGIENPKVMLGWLTIYTSDNPKSPFTKLSMRQQLLSKINEIKHLYKHDSLSIILTGHSLGASLSILAAFDLVENGVTDIPVTSIVFGSPQVGNRSFRHRLNEYPNLKVLHVKNKIDLLVHYPGHLLGYVNIGTEFEIDTRKSPFLKDSKTPGDWHNLQAMLHIVAGWNGEENEFELRVKRSVALVNKSCEFLKDECLVPGSWWVEKNKGMVRDKDGEWMVAPPDEEDLPVPEY